MADDLAWQPAPARSQALTWSPTVQCLDVQVDEATLGQAEAGDILPGSGVDLGVDAALAVRSLTECGRSRFGVRGCPSPRSGDAAMQCTLLNAGDHIQLAFHVWHSIWSDDRPVVGRNSSHISVWHPEQSISK